MRAWLVIVAATAACRAGGTFNCERDDQCTGAATAGTCQPNGFCAFVDPSCTSGERYDPYAGDGLGGVCVGDEPIDAAVDTPAGLSTPLHLAASDGTPGTGDLVLATATINTMTLTVTPPLPAGVTLDARPQLGGGPELVVLHVNALTIPAGAVVTVTGSRPLVIVAGAAVMIDGTLDASGHANVGGPGALTSGPGVGAGGTHLPVYSDTGGGGGGFGTTAGAGGAITGVCLVPASAAGALQGDATITTLGGGSRGGGGSGATCPANAGGGGGGGLQISSATAITIGSTGRVLAGGGGGTGGTDCGGGDGNSGAGGGSGGAIVLQAPTVTSAGVIAANGGGGGGSGSGSGGSGMPGDDAQPSATAALGGTGRGASGIAGGSGAALGIAPQPGRDNSCDNNAGGGGGSVGRIAISASFSDQGVTSPAATATLPL